MTKVLYVLENYNTEYKNLKPILEYLAFLGTTQVFLVSDNKGSGLKYQAITKETYLRNGNRKYNLAVSKSKEEKLLIKTIKDLKLEVIHLINPKDLRILKMCQKISIPLVITFMDLDSLNSFKLQKPFIAVIKKSSVITISSDLNKGIRDSDYKDFVSLTISPFEKGYEETETFKYFCLYNLLTGNT